MKRKAVASRRYPQLRQIYEDVTPEGELEFIMHFESRALPNSSYHMTCGAVRCGAVRCGAVT